MINFENRSAEDRPSGSSWGLTAVGESGIDTVRGTLSMGISTGSRNTKYPRRFFAEGGDKTRFVAGREVDDVAGSDSSSSFFILLSDDNEERRVAVVLATASVILISPLAFSTGAS